MAKSSTPTPTPATRTVPRDGARDGTEWVQNGLHAGPLIALEASFPARAVAIGLALSVLLFWLPLVILVLSF